MGIIQPGDGISSIQGSGTAYVALPNNSQDTWRAVGVNLYVLFLPESEVVPPPTRKSRGVLTNFLSKLLSMDNATRRPEPTSGSVSANRPVSSPANGNFWYGTRHIEGWVFHQVTLPVVVKNKQMLLPEVDLQQLTILLHQMLDEAYSHAEKTGKVEVGYLVIHVKEVRPPEVKSGHPNAANHALRPEFRAILDAFDPLYLREPRGYYRHYDAITKQRGYLAVGRCAALLVNLSDESFSTLALLLQGGALAPHGGFTSEGLSMVLTRIAQWDANQDVLESVAKLYDLKKSTDAATHGQIWLSYALALLGVALSLIAFVPYPFWITPGLIILGLSCVAHARYAQKGNSHWRIGGKIIFWLGVIIVVSGFVLGFLYSPPYNIFVSPPIRN